ncbi:hypothetical protein DTO10_24030 [Peribacillus butanolivorans]|uniref:Uncharacterized protein n=1 Tax=Peribacillus butanolivorans TaxID=421767 RepID=A0ABN5N6T5_9BACI|nr:hypothetical protein DTO10_24030 [Peribacillus butanolivorans]
MLHFYLKKNKLLHGGVLTATAPSFSFIAVTTTHWRPFIPPAAAATAASAIMAMSSLAAAFGKLLNFLHYFFKHIFHLFSSFLALTVLLL